MGNYFLRKVWRTMTNDKLFLFVRTKSSVIKILNYFRIKISISKCTTISYTCSTLVKILEIQNTIDWRELLDSLFLRDKLPSLLRGNLPPIKDKKRKNNKTITYQIVGLHYQMIQKEMEDMDHFHMDPLLIFDLGIRVLYPIYTNRHWYSTQIQKQIILTKKLF